MNHTYVTLSGLVATEPRLSVHANLPITSFRLVATSRRYDAETSTWVDGESTWVTVTCFRGLATHAFKSLSKRDRVIVHGRLTTREWGEQRRVSVEVEADGIGHDLTFGTSAFTRTVGVSAASRAAEADGEEAEDVELGGPEDDAPEGEGLSGTATGAPGDAVEEELLVGAPPF
ncbi:MAG: single-stranded DNA-binding protein [Kineosporiaceae bacterium]